MRSSVARPAWRADQPGRIAFRFSNGGIRICGQARRHVPSMSTYLIASNEVMCRVLARRLQALSLPSPIRWRAPRWLDEADAATSTEHVEDPADMALLDCSGIEGDPRALLDRLHARLAPRRWLLISTGSMPLSCCMPRCSARVAAPGRAGIAPNWCARAARSVGAGGQCFPRTALTLTGGPSPASLICPAGTTAIG
ncbi:DNA-binding response regulator [Cupriavidus basilensis]